MERSLPSRERGLKFVEARFKVTVDFVAPLAGAWIEILKRQNVSTKRLVAPFAGAWIEMRRMTTSTQRGCVAPFAGAWIEISLA